MRSAICFLISLATALLVCSSAALPRCHFEFISSTLSNSNPDTTRIANRNVIAGGNIMTSQRALVVRAPAPYTFELHRCVQWR